MNTLTKFKIKSRSGRTTLFYWYYIFPPAGLLYFISIVFFEPIFGINTESSNAFIIVSFYVIPLLIVLAPILFIYGFASKKMQKKYLKNKIIELECSIENYKKIIIIFKNQMNYYLKEQLRCIKEQEEEDKLYIKNLKSQLIDNTRILTKESESSLKEIVDSIDDKFVIAKFELKSIADKYILDIEDILLDDILELNNNSKKMKDLFKKESNQLVIYYNKLNEDRRKKILIRIKENKDMIILYSIWLKVI